MEHVLEMDPEEAVHDDRCPNCGSTDIGFVKDRGIYAASGVWAGKPYQRVKKSLWFCDTCARAFVSNKFITE